MTDDLWRVFVDPPDDARPRAWWHWMDGNVDPEGVRRDLRWLHSVGVRGVQLFEGGMGMPLVVPEPVRPGSATWLAAIDAAVTTADELGLELAVATSAGWSAAGGPWVEPADAMKKVVWSETSVSGGGSVEVELRPLPATAGLYQDAPRWGSSPDAARWSIDWVVLAVPAVREHVVHVPRAVEASGPVTEWGCLVDGSFDAALSLPRDPDAWSTAWIDQVFDEPVTVRSVVVGLPGPRGFGAAPAPHAVLQASDDAVVYRDVAALPVTTVPARTASFAAVTARRFRLVLSAASAADALPPLDEGVRVPPVLRRADAFVLSEFALREASRVSHAEVKAGFGVVPDYYAVDSDPNRADAVVEPADVIDLTRFVDAGVLRWEAPPGDWTVLRLGASLTGQTNGPASADATGLEVDKLDRARVAAYFDEHLARFGADAGFTALLSDSIESGAQNWTDAILERFTEARGYDARPWLPALTGLVVRGPEASDRFLYDYRRTIAELLAREYYGTLASSAHERGMTYYAEALEDQRPQLGDDLAMRSHADVPMGAGWTFRPESGPGPTYVADLKGAASVAHVHGKRWTGAEAFSSFDRPLASSPRALKHVADLQLALGVTRFCIHTSPHQPLAAPPPGIALAPFLGQAFTVNETWARDAGPWIDYLARCSAVLASGEPAVEIATFVGEEAPVTGLFGAALDDAVPAGFDFDYVGPDGLALLSVDEGDIMSRGARYRVLHLGGSSHRMTVATLRRLADLLDAGATIVGMPPESSPSLADDPREFARLRDSVWTLPRARGRIVATHDVAEALDELGIRPALELDDTSVRRIARVVDGRRITFVANPHDADLTVTATSRVGATGWDPIEVRRVALPELGSDASGARRFEVHLAPFGSVFLVEDDEAEPIADFVTTESEIAGEWVLDLPGAPRVELGASPRLWTDASPAGQGFAGTGVYRVTTELGAPLGPHSRTNLDLGEVRDIARVAVNGVDCGVAWTAPFRVDVTDALRTGVNDIEVHVTTPWRNRLVAEAAAPSGEIFAPMTTVYEPTAAPQPAGLGGPVRLVTARPRHPSTA